jgi:hypothetical protein
MDLAGLYPDHQMRIVWIMRVHKNNVNLESKYQNYQVQIFAVQEAKRDENSNRRRDSAANWLPKHSIYAFRKEEEAFRLRIRACWLSGVRIGLIFSSLLFDRLLLLQYRVFAICIERIGWFTFFWVSCVYETKKPSAIAQVAAHHLHAGNLYVPVSGGVMALKRICLYLSLTTIVDIDVCVAPWKTPADMTRVSQVRCALCGCI